MKKILILLLVCMMIVTSVQAFEFTYTPDQVEKTICYGPWTTNALTVVGGTNYEDYPLVMYGQYGLIHGGTRYVYIDPDKAGLDTMYVMIAQDPANPLPIGEYTGEIHFTVLSEPPIGPWLEQHYYIPVYLHVKDCTTPPIPAPEFPSYLLPVAMIIGLLGTVHYIRCVRSGCD